MSVLGLSSICHMVSDWDRARQFYGESLGLKLLSADDAAGWAAYAVGTSSLPFFLVRKGEGDERSGAIVGFEVENASELLLILEAAGAKIQPEIQEGSGVRIFTVCDPEGNIIEISESRAISSTDASA